MKRIDSYWIIGGLTAFIVFASIFAPARLISFTDSNILNKVHFIPDDDTWSGYRYSLDTGQRIHILSMALNSRNRPKSEYAALLRAAPFSDFAFTVNHKGPSVNEIPYDEVMDVLAAQLSLLQEKGIIPEDSFQLSGQGDITLYTAIDVSDPQRNVSVWQIRLGNLPEAYLDAETGKLYGFSLRTEKPPEYFEPEAMILNWCDYLGIGTPEPNRNEALWLEETPYYKRYDIGREEDVITYTVGYYEGVNEVFIMNYE